MHVPSTLDVFLPEDSQVSILFSVIHDDEQLKETQQLFSAVDRAWYIEVCAFGIERTPS